MSSAKLISTEPLEELRKGILELLENGEKQATDLQISRAKLLMADSAVQALRGNLAGLEALLQKEAAKLDPENKKVAKVITKLKALRRKAKKAIQDYDPPGRRSRSQQLVQQDGPEENLTSVPLPLLAQVDALAQLYQDELGQRRKRVVMAGLAIVILPIAGFMVGLQAIPQIDRSAQSVLPAITQGGPFTIVAQPVVKPQYLYTVKPGDTLSKIAQFFYGDSDQWAKLYEANKEKMVSPNQLETGQELIIP